MKRVEVTFHYIGTYKKSPIIYKKDDTLVNIYNIMTINNPVSGGEYHRLHVQFRSPDDGRVRPETCRGKRIAEIICRRKRKVYRVGNKEK